MLDEHTTATAIQSTCCNKNNPDAEPIVESGDSNPSSPEVTRAQKGSDAHLGCPHKGVRASDEKHLAARNLNGTVNQTSNLKLYQKSVTSKSHNSLNSIFKMNLKSPQVISVEGSGHRLKGSLVESNKLSGSLTKVKNFGGKFQNMALETNGDQFYNKIKVVEVNSVLDDLKDESTCYGQSRLRSDPKFNTNIQQNTFGGSGILKKSLLGSSPDAHLNKTRIILCQVEECLLQMHQLLNRQGIFDKSVSENTSEVYNQSNHGQLHDCLTKLQQQHQSLVQHFQFNHQSILSLEAQIKESSDAAADLSRRLEDMTSRCQVSQKELEKLEKDDERHRYKIQQLNIKLKQTQQESKAKIVEVTQNLMKHRINAEDNSPFVCVHCGTVNYPEDSSNDEANNTNGKTQEIVNIQNKYSSMIRQKQVRITELEEQLITSQNQLDEERQDNYKQQLKIINQNKKLAAENHVLKSDREKYQAQKDKLLYENREITEQFDQLKALYDRLKEENSQLIEWRAMQRNQEFAHNQQYLNQSAQFANSSENELASRHFRKNSQFQSIVNKLPSLIQCSQSSRHENYRSPDMQTRYEAINRSQVSPPKRQSLTNAGGGASKEHPTSPSMLQQRSPAKKCNTIGILQEQEGATSQIYKKMAASKSALYASQMHNCIIEEDDAETRKGGSGGSKNEGRLFDLQQIHLFQFNQKTESPLLNPHENQQMVVKQQEYQSMMQSEYLDSNAQFYKEQSLRGRLNASYISKQGSTDLVEMLNGYSMPRSHSCKSNSQYVTRNSKLSASNAKSRDQNSKSADTPFKMIKIASNNKWSKSPLNQNGQGGANEAAQINKSNLAFQKAMTFVNQAQIGPDCNYNDYADNYNNNNQPIQISQPQQNQWNAQRDFYRESYKQWRESIDNQSLKKVIFHGQSPSTMLKITSKVKQFGQSSFQQSQSPAKEILNNERSEQKQKKLRSEESNTDKNQESYIDNRSDNSPVRIRSNMQSLVLNDQKSIHSKKSTNNNNLMGGGSFNMHTNGFGYTNSKAQRVGRENNNNQRNIFADESAFKSDINNLQIDIQNRINFAIMKIDQMNLTQDMQSTLHNRSRFEDRSYSQLQTNHPNDYSNNLLDLTQEKSQNNILEALNNNPELTPQNNHPEFTPQNKYCLDRRLTEMNDRLCETGRTNTSHMTGYTQRQVNEHSNFIRNTLLQLRQLVNERLEEETRRKQDIGLQKRYIEKGVGGASATKQARPGLDCELSQKSHSQVVDVDRLRRTIGMHTDANYQPGEQFSKNNTAAYATNYKKEKKASKSNANYQKFLNNLHQDEKRWQRYVDVINNQMTIDPNALKNKYMQKEQKEQDTSLYIHRHVEADDKDVNHNKRRIAGMGQKETKAQKGRVSGLFDMENNNVKDQVTRNIGGGRTDRTNKSKNQPIIKKKQLDNIMHLQKKYEQAKEKVANDRLRDNIHRRRQILENQQQAKDDYSPQPVMAAAVINTERHSNQNKEFLQLQKQVKQQMRHSKNEQLLLSNTINCKPSGQTLGKPRGSYNCTDATRPHLQTDTDIPKSTSPHAKGLPPKDNFYQKDHKMA